MPDTSTHYRCPHCASTDIETGGLSNRVLSCNACSCQWHLNAEDNLHYWPFEDDCEMHVRLDLDDYCEVISAREDGTSREDDRDDIPGNEGWVLFKNSTDGNRLHRELEHHAPVRR